MSTSRAAFSRLRMPRIAGVRLLPVLVASFVLAGWSGLSYADKAKCDVFEIKASNDKGGMDAKLKPLRKKLKNPPFSAWKTFKLVKQHAIKATRMKAVSVSVWCVIK
jgi:hypothetical protein